MAEDEDLADLSKSQLNAGDEYFDVCCTKCCKKHRKTRQASKYCVNCKRYFCVSCVEDHDSFDAMAGHVMVDADSKTSAGTGTCLVTMPTELCMNHPLKLVDMYCADDDTVGCSVCFNFDHKHCPNTYFIPDYLQSHSTTKQVHETSIELTEAVTAMTTLYTQQHSPDSVLDNSKSLCKQEIQNYRDEINQIFDKLEENTQDKLEAKYAEIKTKKDNTIGNIQRLRDDMTRLKSELDLDISNDSQKFVTAKLGQSLIKQCRKLESEKYYRKCSTLTFIRNTDITSFLSTMSILGTTGQTLPKRTRSRSRFQSIPPRPTRGPSVSEANSQSRNVRDSVDAKKCQNRESYPTVDKSDYNMKEADEKCKCEIWSSCSLDNKQVLLADSNNNKIKLVDCGPFTIKCSLALDTKVLSVCKVNDSEAAVCLNNKTIQFVSTDGRLEVKRSLTMNHNCRCMTVIRDKMYIGYDRCVYVYKLNGKIVRTISKDKQGQNLFSNIWDITASADEKMIHVADYPKGVITLTTDGKVVWRYTGSELNGANGVCTDGTGHVIVIGHESCNVIRLGQDGRYKGEIVPTTGQEKPRTVCFDRHNGRIIVGTSEDLVVYTINRDVNEVEI